MSLFSLSVITYAAYDMRLLQWYYGYDVKILARLALSFVDRQFVGLNSHPVHIG